MVKQDTKVKDLTTHPNARLLPFNRCGRNAAETTERVRIGYNRANLGEYPWVAQLGELRGEIFINKYYSLLHSLGKIDQLHSKLFFQFFVEYKVAI